ncbi:AAA family ATPase [Streptomyces globosus]|uniref:AAA family ATPase n=1 Tax=Streptomyces globosus TaxID=68209 RepID=UPI0013B3CE42|nr:AAA family ATPase [Streptomyces globosus]
MLVQICDVAIEGFRSLASVPYVPIKSQTVVTGQNDGGKSALLDALDFLISGKALSEHDISYAPNADLEDEEFEIPRMDQILVTGTFQLKVTEQVQFDLPEYVKIRRTFRLDGSTVLEVRRRVCREEDLRNLAKEKVASLREIAAKYGVQPTGRADAKKSWTDPLGELEKTLPRIEEWVEASDEIAAAMPTIVHFKGDSVQSPEAVLQNILNPKLRDYSKSDASREKIEELENHFTEALTSDIDKISQHVSKRCGFASVSLSPQVQVRPHLARVEVRVANHAGREIPLTSAGTGRSRRVSLALWESSNDIINDDADVVYLYDEPDTHLDYEHQRRIMNLIHDQSSHPNARVVVATHSMNLIDGVDISSVVHLRVGDSGAYVELISEGSGDDDVRKHLSSIATALGFRNSVLLHERYFVAVEGASEAACFPILFKKYAGIPIQSAGICLWDGGSNEGALKFARFLKKHRRDVAFVVDKDSRTDKRKIFRDDKLKEYGFSLEKDCYYLGRPNELEDLFEDEDWAGAANSLWEPAGRGAWTPRDFSDHRGAKFSSGILTMLKEGSLYGPKGKDAMVIGLATWIEKDRIPAALTDVFDALVRSAQSAGPHPWD